MCFWQKGLQARIPVQYVLMLAGVHAALHIQVLLCLAVLYCWMLVAVTDAMVCCVLLTGAGGDCRGEGCSTGEHTHSTGAMLPAAVAAAATAAVTGAQAKGCGGAMIMT
jgi:membrane glycosyltransferase